MEWVEFEPREGQRIAFHDKYNTLGQLRAWTRAQRAVVALAQGSSFATFEAELDALCESLAVLVADWDLQDDAGKPLPRPARPEAFFYLTIGEDGEIAWIVAELRKRLSPDPKS